MESIFEPMSMYDAGAFDSTFLSFSSLSSSPSAPCSSTSFKHTQQPLHLDYTTGDLSPHSDATSTFVDLDTFAPSDAGLYSTDPFDFDLFGSAFDASPTLSDVGIFHSGSSKLSRADVHAYNYSLSPSRPGSSEYDSPLVTPAVKGNPAFTSPDILRSGFSWDETSLASSSYIPPPATPTPLRVASNPTLGQTSRQHAIRPVHSMPALKEEEPLNWLNLPDEPLGDDFDWVFGDLGLGDTPLDGTIFSAFKEEKEPEWDLTNLSIPTPTPVAPPPTLDAQIAAPSTFVMDEQYTMDPRPMTAPDMSFSFDGMGGMDMLSAPGTMTRSYTAPGIPLRSAPPSDIFYQPPYPPPQQSTQFLSSFPPPRSLSARRASTLSVNVNAPPQFSSYSLPITPQSATYPSSSQSMAPTPAASMQRAGTQPLPTRRASSSAAPTSQPGPMPAHLLRAQAIVQMQEAKEEAQRQELRRQAASRRVPMSEASVMQPLHPPTSRPAIVGWEASGASGSQPPPHTLPATHPPPHYPIHMRAVSHPAPPHVLPNNMHQSHQQIVHPPPHYPAPPPHRVHPPPAQSYMPLQQTTTGRPMARLPSPKRRSVTSPTKRSPSGKRRAPMQPGGFSWGEATFINFTPDDAEKLLTGVAPSGSQAKRKREEEAARMAAAGEYSMMGGMHMGAMGTGTGMTGSSTGFGTMLGVEGLEMDREGSKRSRTSSGE